MPIVVIPFFSELSDNEWRTQMLSRMRATGVHVTDPGRAAEQMESVGGSGTHVYLFVGTGGTERMIADFVLQNRLRPEVFLLSHSQANSLASALETRAYLSAHGLNARIFHEKTEGLPARLFLWRRFAEAEARLASTRLGLIGEPSSWLVASKVDAAGIKARWGTTIVSIPMSELSEGISDVVVTQSRNYVTGLEKDAMHTDRDPAKIQGAARVLERTLELVRKHRLDAVTIECFDLLSQKRVTGCVALAGLNDMGVTAGCEGDVPSTFTMHVVRTLIGGVSFMANITDIGPEDGTITLAHCTVPISMTERYEITSHFESGESVGIRGIMPEEDVTVFRISGEELSHYWIAEGRVIENLRDEKSCRTQVRVSLERPVQSVLDDSLGNHHVVIAGRHALELVEFLSFCGVRQGAARPLGLAKTRPS